MSTHYLRDYNCLCLIFRGKFFLFQDACLTRALVLGGLFGFAVNAMAPSAVQPTTEYFSYKQAFLGINELSATLAVATSSICLYCNTLGNGLFLR